MSKKYHLTPKYRYTQQMKTALKRNIKWIFTFESWWDVWQQSGHYSEMGNKKGCYCMARTNDEGPYSRDNVRICTVEENHREAVNSTRKHTSIENQNCVYGPRIPWNKDKTYPATDNMKKHLNKVHKKNQKVVVTPLGEFNSIKEGAEANNVHAENARRWCHENKNGWKFA